MGGQDESIGMNIAVVCFKPLHCIEGSVITAGFTQHLPDLARCCVAGA